MKIEFEEDRSNGYLMYFAISKMEVWKGKVHDELMWAELTPVPGKPAVQVIWEDDYYNPLTFTTLDEAKNHINKNFLKHAPHINGSSYNVPR